ncbi:MAG TPA: glycosyltransferase [Gemmatimonadaceae bacterium]|nr:glycosyltransferase [Gemmatimonadaceae bacterium]
MIALAIGAAYVALLVAKTALAFRAARRGPQPRPEAEWDFSGVVIAQPILSGDPRLADVLETNVGTLPSAHFIWLIDSDDPVANTVCRAIAARHPEVRIEILVAPPPPDACNPKLFKLEMARSLVGDRTLLVLDDDTCMPAASLSALLAGLEDHDIATGLPGYLDDDHWPSQLLAQFVNNNAALTYLPLLNFWPPPTINGMAYVIRGATLDRLGGFAPLTGYLTDDLAVAQLVLSSGGSIAQTAWPQWVQTTVPNSRQYVRQMHRWFVFARLLLRTQPRHMQLVIALLYALPGLLLWGLVVTVLLAPSPLALTSLAFVVAARALALIALQRRVYGRALHRPLLSLVSELCQPLHLVHASLVQTIVWRTRRYNVRNDHSFRSLA